MRVALVLSRIVRKLYAFPSER